MIPVQRFVAHVKPDRSHPEYFEWQTAVACVFIGDEDRERAQKRADYEIRRRGWERIEFIERATLIEERVRSEGGPVLEAYVQARNGVPFWVEQLDEIPFSTKGNPIDICVPRLTEAFIDQVVVAAGGERIDIDEANPKRPKTADYRIGRLVLELKDLQAEGLEVESRQAKLAELFSSKLRPDRSVLVDVGMLDLAERRRYVEIVGAPVHKRLAEAGQQVRATLERSKDGRLHGGAILLNSGYGSLAPEVLAEVAANYAARSTTVTTVICISAWTLTNGFDTIANFDFQPRNGGTRPLVRFRKAFWAQIRDLMTTWARSSFDLNGPSSEPLRPTVFETQSGVFSHVPPKPPNSVGWPSRFDPPAT